MYNLCLYVVRSKIQDVYCSVVILKYSTGNNKLESKNKILYAELIKLVNFRSNPSILLETYKIHVKYHFFEEVINHIHQDKDVNFFA